MTDVSSSFVDVNEIKTAIDHGQGLSIIASLWENGPGGGDIRFQSEHIPTAQFCDPQMYLSGLPGSAAGRNPLPELVDLQRGVEKWGLPAEFPVVVYDQGSGIFAGRAWWILRWAGVEDVRIIDGGFVEWEKQGGRILGGPGGISFHDRREVTTGRMPVATIDDVRTHEGVLIDVRQPNRFAGRREILDLKAGHIPGAINVPVDDLFDDHRLVKSPEEIRERFAAAGVADTEGAIIYSGSGNHSALAIAAIEHAGMTIPRHYVGGWSQWSADVRNPVERGE